MPFFAVGLVFLPCDVVNNLPCDAGAKERARGSCFKTSMNVCSLQGD